MKQKVVDVPVLKHLVNKSPGFAKKDLSDYKLDVAGLCDFGCTYCSSNHGNYLRMHRAEFADFTAEQLGERVLPADEPRLAFNWPDVLDKLHDELAIKRPGFGRGKTLVYSMLTDGFGPRLVRDGTTRRALDLILEHTEFRIRVLTKNAIVGKQNWLDYFAAHRGRFVVGLSIGSLDDAWAKKIEVFTPPPSSRLRAMAQLQDAGIPTYGMLCPVFPDVLEGVQLDQLIDRIRPDLVEHVWAEPYNDRANWKKVRSGYSRSSFGYRWLTDVYEKRDTAKWSEYATELYVRLRDKARKEGWMHKLRYLLYESNIVEEHAGEFTGLEGVLLQAKPDEHGLSRNDQFANLQA